MHLARRGYVLVLLTAVLAVVAVWSDDPQLARWWLLPAGLLLAGLAIESAVALRFAPTARLAIAPRAYLGHAIEAAFTFANGTGRPVALEYVPLAPAGFAAHTEVHRVVAPARGSVADGVTLLPVRLGPQSWPSLPARLRGPVALAWWSRRLPIEAQVVVAPDALRRAVRARGMGGGVRVRRVLGAGSELHQLRGYLPGDPLARIDWKASARTGELITREYSEDQHLDVLVAIDAGRLSRLRCGALDRFGLYGNIAARLAEVATRHDDRIGLVVYADRVLATRAPARGLAATIALRHALERSSVQAAESDPTVAAVTIRTLLRHRALVILLTDLDDASVAHQLARAVRLLAPPHLVLVAGVQSGEIAQLAQQLAHDWQDPYVAIAAAEHEARTAGQRALLTRLGAPVVAAPATRLEEQVFARYEALRRARRV
ncbi:MAG TPA: DUF58 domain-containing protein [Steroidobacteraceae bacterium]|jgi:uncharacterized protein (DUF58 family)|nr:DUF58 domain-containing protein [Steroidobacteraceae bacterium]